jgi:dTDP-L-rhamnose 4-epimerase
MRKRVLITGGAGFIGSHVADLLLQKGYSVRIIDCLTAQVHGVSGTPPLYLNPEAELIVGDVRDPNAVSRALAGVDEVIHLAASVGVGQSMYDMVSYIQVNECGTAVLLEALAKQPVRRLVVASSMSIYGEGAARDATGNIVSPTERSLEQLRRSAWELEDGTGQPLAPIPTAETKQPSLSSVYALNKYAQERLCLIAGRAYAIPTIALRFFNVFGTRQALSNPYTGVLAIFASRLLNNRPPLIFEDGLQQRDFVHVSDVARSCLLALETERGIGEAFNVGSGEQRTVLSIAEDLAHVMGRESVRPHVLGKYRAGDIRHCFADISHSRNALGFEPRMNFRSGLAELAEWLSGQVAEDRVEHAAKELESRGLVA